MRSSVLRKLGTILLLLTSVALRALAQLVPIDRNIWVFGSGNGCRFADNSKHLFLFIHENIPDVTPVWIARRRKVVSEVRALGGKAYHNLSPIGLFYVLRSAVYAFSTNPSDVLFAFRHPGRHHVNLWHGMPIKRIVYDYEGVSGKADGMFSRLWMKWVVGFDWSEIDVCVASAPFFVPFLTSAFRNPRIYVTGQPRNDALFQDGQPSLVGDLGIETNRRILYMPTHREYGRGAISPKLFAQNPQALEVLRRHDAIILFRLHPNMMFKARAEGLTIDLPLIDVSTSEFDPQDLLRASDILITDYSSCFVDFALLNRPTLFYHYDDYSQADNPLYFDIGTSLRERVATSEEELIALLETHLESGQFCPTEFELSLNTYRDGDSALRVASLLRGLQGGSEVGGMYRTRSPRVRPASEPA